MSLHGSLYKGSLTLLYTDTFNGARFSAVYGMRLLASARMD